MYKREKTKKKKREEEEEEEKGDACIQGVTSLSLQWCALCELVAQVGDAPRWGSL